MNMFKQALFLLKSGKANKGTTLQRRLILFFSSMASCLILLCMLLLLVFGITGRETKTVRTYFDNEMSHISKTVYDDFGRISLDGIAMAESIAASCDSFFKKNNMEAGELALYPSRLEELLMAQMQTLRGTMNRRSCGGAFILLDATVQPEAPAAAVSKAGIFLVKTQPTAAGPSGVKNYYLRGPAAIAREYGIDLLGQWSMEYDISNEQFFLDIMNTARNNPEMPLSRLYYWTGRVLMSGNNEAGFMLCVPLRSADGAVFGVCGFQVSDRMFKQLYCPDNGVFQNVFTIAAPCEGGALRASAGLIAGNYYLTSKHMESDLALSRDKNGFEVFSGAEVYCGASDSLRLYPTDSPYAEERWSVAVMMPEALLKTALRGSSGYLILIMLLLLAASLGASAFISRRYLRPVKKALDSIKTNSYGDTADNTYSEISDLFEYLADKDKAAEERRRLLEKQRVDAQTMADDAQKGLTRLIDKRKKEIDTDAFELFLSNLVTLTPKEREVFDLYLDGRSAREIMSILNINENTLKYHNRNIYGKLGVASKKELLLYAELMKHGKA